MPLTGFLTGSEMRYLGGPIIQPHLNGWDFPLRLVENMSVIRWTQVMRGLKDQEERPLASEEEALGYLSCVSLEAPLDRDWADIMLHLGERVLPRWFLTDGQSALEAIGLTHPIELNRQQAEELRRFRRWLREKIEGGARKTPRQTGRKNHTMLEAEDESAEPVADPVE
jgi:hypothetical protein